jgi:hypothetical protein
MKTNRFCVIRKGGKVWLLAHLVVAAAIIRF